MPFDSPDPAALLLALAFRSTLLLATAFLATLLLRRGSAAIRHMIWAAAIFGLLALPVLSSLPGLRVLPRWTAPESVAELISTLPRPIEGLPATHTIATVSPTSKSNGSDDSAPAKEEAGWGRPPSLVTLLAALWIAGAGVALLPPILGRILLARIQRRATPLIDPPIARVLDQALLDLGIRRRVHLLLGEPNTMPMAWGLFSPRILLPREATSWPASRLRAVLLHELAHIKRHDCLSHLLAQIARAMYWPNPLAWLAVRALHTERERACDDMVLHAGEQSTDYASQLLSLASGRRLSPASAAAMAMARPSQLEHRIRSILDTHRSRSTMNRKQLFIAASLALAVVLPIAGLKSALAQPEKQPRRRPPGSGRRLRSSRRRRISSRARRPTTTAPPTTCGGSSSEWPSTGRSMTT
jgi:beta-lactamase regulating signal transducer with metallopeptidase domain